MDKVPADSSMYMPSAQAKTDRQIALELWASWINEGWESPQKELANSLNFSNAEKKDALERYDKEKE